MILVSYNCVQTNNYLQINRCNEIDEIERRKYRDDCNKIFTFNFGTT